MLLLAAFWRSDSVGNSTVLLQRLCEIQPLTTLARAVSTFICQLIAEACSHGKQPVISLHSLLVEVTALLFGLADMYCTQLYCTVQHCTLYCIHTMLPCTALCCSVL